MKLKDLKKRDGSGAWPEKSDGHCFCDCLPCKLDGECWNCEGGGDLCNERACCDDTHDMVLGRVGSLNLGVDVEALAKVVHKEFCYQPYWQSLSNWDKARMAKDKEGSVPFKLSEVIAARLSEWLVVEEDNHEGD